MLYPLANLEVSICLKFRLLVGDGPEIFSRMLRNIECWVVELCFFTSFWFPFFLICAILLHMS